MATVRLSQSSLYLVPFPSPARFVVARDWKKQTRPALRAHVGTLLPAGWSRKVERRRAQRYVHCSLSIRLSAAFALPFPRLEPRFQLRSTTPCS